MFDSWPLGKYKSARLQLDEDPRNSECLMVPLAGPLAAYLEMFKFISKEVKCLNSYLLLLQLFHYGVWVVMVMGSWDSGGLLEKVYVLCEVIHF